MRWPTSLILRTMLMSTAIGLVACAPSSLSEVASRAAVNSDPPPMKSFAARRAEPTSRSNAELVEDFLELSFQMESGRILPFMTRFTGPVRVGVIGTAPASLEFDLSQLLDRLRREAGIDIRRAQRGEDAEIIIDAIPRKTLQRAVPQAACFVVPNVAGWREFRSNRLGESTDWARLAQRKRATIIIPSDVSPQEVRDCLHEEVAQALGPLNDLYRLPNSIFNDDNFHTVLTGFDMMILRAYYAPELRNGMSRNQARAALPALLARINPAGETVGTSMVSATPKAWNSAISSALRPHVSAAKRAELAAQAVQIAKAEGWKDNRLAFSLFVQGRVTLGQTPQLAISSFVEAGRLYRDLYGTSVQAAHVSTQMAAFALSAGQYETAVKMTDEAIPAARNGENAALLATLLMIKAQALEGQDRIEDARAVRLDALGWGRYGFGSDKNVRARLDEISALTPKQG